MITLAEAIQARVQTKVDKKIDYEYQALGLEMKEKMGNCFFLFYKYPLPNIREAWKVCSQRGIFTIPYMIGIMKRLK